MPQDLDGLKEALADRYAVERELGRGGMATVYLATDLKHHRPVAIKVLKPELAAALGPDRFLREIEVTAGLHHPHVLPLYDSGRIGGSIDGSMDRRIGDDGSGTSVDPSSRRSVDLLYYVMPFVEGESLRDRLERERQLPLEEALQLTREVAEALSYAHSHGVIHRDIKPENILLENGHALLADFGIAKALTAAGGERLTTTGISIGTPAYMSPEQASGTDRLDGRSDLYSLGCVLYEMLAGHPPFTGTTAHELLARHATDPVPPLRTGRATIPEPIEEAVEQVLAKVPADRFATAQQFSTALQIDATAYRRRKRRLGRLRVFGLAVGAAVMIAVAVYGVTGYNSATAWKARPVDPNVVAVFPFRVTSADSSIQMLDEGIGDLFHGQLTGEAGLRAVNPTSLLRAWKGLPDERRETDPDAVLEVATRFQAGQALEGSIVQAGTQLTLNAWLRRVPGGDETGRVTVTGPADSIAVLQYRLAMQLLGSQLGETTERVESFVGRDPRAVMAYLAGVRAYRDGRQQDAYVEWSRAEAFDSGFALPVLGLARINLPLPGEDFYATLARAVDARRRAWGLRGQISPREQARLVVDSLADPANPGSALDVLDAVQRWADLAPDDAEALYGLIDALWSVGNLAGVPNWRPRLEAARLKAWELDSITARSVQEQVWNAFRHRDGEWLRRVAPAFLRLADTTADAWAGWRWAIALATGDSDRVREFREQTAGGDPKLLTRTTAGALLEGAREGWYSLFDRKVVEREMQARGIPGINPSGAFMAGRVSDATQWMMEQREPYWWMFVVELSVVYPGLHGVAAVAAESLRVYSARTPPLAVTDPADSPPAFVYGCIADLPRAWHRDTVGLRARMAELKSLYQQIRQPDVCPAMVEALLEAAGETQVATPALDRLERMLRTELTGWDWPAGSGLLLVARLARARGDLARALKAAGDRGLAWSNLPRNLLYGYLREEGELAVLLGDTARAIRAYDHYLMLAIDPDPGSMRAQVDSVRAALDALLRAKG